MYIDRIWPFTTFISRNKHNKNIRLRLYWLRLRVAEAEVQTSQGRGEALEGARDTPPQGTNSFIPMPFSEKN